MRQKGRSFGRYLSTEREKEMVMKTKINFGRLLTECCKDFDETDDSGKLVILKNIIIMILTLMDSDEVFSVEVKPFSLSE